MKQLKYILSISVLFAALASCTNDFSEINVNPNNATDPLPGSLLSPAIHATVSYSLGRAKAINNELMQVHVTTNSTNDIHRYEIRATYYDGPWNNWYIELGNVRTMYQKAAEKNDYKYMGIALTLDCWITSLITDVYGDVPDTEASRGREQIYQPSFDKQKDIYLRMFEKLDSANVYLQRVDATTTDVFEISLDALYKGDVSKWRKFTNSLHLRLLMRLSKKEGEMDIKARVAKIVGNSSEYPLFGNNDDSAILRFTGEVPLQSPFYNSTDFNFNGNNGLAEFFVHNLLEWNDPRIGVWATQATLGAYWGIQSGYAVGNTPEIASKLHGDLRTSPLMGNIMNYSELQFILAEASIRAWVPVDAKKSYEEGIKSSIALWVDSLPLTPDKEAFYTDYLQNPALKWEDGEGFSQKLSKIMKQKYYALFFTDFQQWHEYRRTGYPTLAIGPGVRNGGRMPARLKYPVYLQNLNKVSYTNAVTQMGGDDINTKMWWQK